MLSGDDVLPDPQRFSLNLQLRDGFKVTFRNSLKLG